MRCKDFLNKAMINFIIQVVSFVPNDVKLFVISFLLLTKKISMHSMGSFKSKEIIAELVGGKVANIHSIIINPSFS